MAQVIEAKQLSKMFSIGSKENFRERLSSFLYSPLQKLKILASQNSLQKPSKEFWALRDLTFSIQNGESVAIIGSNGSGKSTLFKILSKIIYPTAGSATVRGKITSLLEVGTGFHPELTGLENIFLNGSILGMSYREIKRHLDEIVDFAEIERFINTPVKHYSSGMYVRLAFAVAAHLDPEIFLVDEVLAVGDARFQKKCFKKMGDVMTSGRTILFVSHNTHALRSLCKRGMWLNQGVIKADGDIEHVIEAYHETAIENNHVTKWSPIEAPGNQQFRILEVRAFQGDKPPPFYISRPIEIEITFEITGDSSYISHLLSVNTEDDLCIFQSINNQEGQFYGKKMSKGIYTSNAIIPGCILNNQKYAVSLKTTAGFWHEALQIERAISFEIHDDGILRGDYAGSFLGITRPKISWNTQNTT